MALHHISRGPVSAGGFRFRGGPGFFTGETPPVNGTNIDANTGSIYYDSVTGISWTNVGTLASPIWSPLGPVSKALTAANIQGMFATPVSVLAAPPAGYFLSVRYATLIMTRTATAFAGGGAVSFVYAGGAVPVHEGSIPASVITGGAGTVITRLGAAAPANGTTVPTATGVNITNATAAFTTGTGTGVVRIAYDIVKQAA